MAACKNSFWSSRALSLFATEGQITIRAPTTLAAMAAVGTLLVQPALDARPSEHLTTVNIVPREPRAARREDKIRTGEPKNGRNGNG